MPTLLDRYILGDLLRVFLLTTVVLVTVIAFGATLKPLTSDGLLSVADTVKYLLLAIVPMLQFALPFAAGFASTLVLHRMTTDNEIMAAAASGISYRRLLAPIAGLGIALTLVMVLLTQWAIPRFWFQMERTITADITRLFEASIDSGQPFQIGSLQIYADHLWVVPNPSDTQADTRLILSRVAAAELDADGRIETDVTANQAVVDIYRLEEETFLKLVLTDTVAFDGSTEGGRGQLARLPQIEPTHAIAVPSAFRDETRAMTRGQLLRLRSTPERHSRIMQEKVALAEAIANVELWATIAAHLSGTGELELSQSAPGHRRYVILADHVRGGRFTTDDGRPVEVRQVEGDVLVRSIRAEEARLNRLSGLTVAAPMFELELLDVEVRDMRGDSAINRRERLADHNLNLTGFATHDFAELPTGMLLDYAAAMGSSAVVTRAAHRLTDRLLRLDREINSRLLSRYAQSFTALLLLTLGATLSMWLRGSLPLITYLWAFVPSIIALILISGGDKMLRDGNLLGGLAVMWSGNGALLAMLIFCYGKLRRN